MERETGFEPATSTLARSHSTAELLPLSSLIINEAFERGKINAITTGKARGTRHPPPACLLFFASPEGLVHWGAFRSIFARLEGRSLQHRRGISSWWPVHCGSRSGGTISPSRM